MSLRKVKIGDFLKRSKIPIDIENNKSYKRVTIRTKHQGVSLRDEEIGEKIGTKKQFVLKEGQFVLSKIDARYGAFGIAPAETNGAIITGNFWAYDVDKSMMNINWLNQYTNSPAFYELCERASSGITHRKYLNEDFFLHHELMIPDTEEQDSHVVFIESRRKLFGDLEYFKTYQLDLLKKLRQQILQDAGQGKLVAQDPNDEPASILLERIKAEKEKLIREKKIKKEQSLPPIKPEEILFEVPENWTWCRLGDICSHISDIDHNMPKSVKSGGVKFLSAKDLLDDGSINFVQNVKYISDEDFIRLSKKIVPQKWDIIYSRIGAKLGKSRIVKIDEKFLVSYSCCTIRTLNPSIEFLNSLLDSGFVLKQATGNTTDHSIPDLGIQKIKEFIIPLPPSVEQYRIVNKIERLMKLCCELEQYIHYNQKYTQDLLQVVLKEALEPKI